MQLGNFIGVFLAQHVSVHTHIIRSIRCWVAAYGAENHTLQLNILMLRMMGVYTRNMLSYEYINKIT